MTESVLDHRRSIRLIILGLVGLLMAVGALVPMTPASAQPSDTYYVNTTADAPDQTPNDGMCDIPVAPGDPSLCSLRAAIETANEVAGEQVITFANPSMTIVLLDSLPPVEGPADIHGFPANAGSPGTTIDGNGEEFGFELVAPGSQLHGLQIGGFTHRAVLLGGGEVYANQFEGNHITSTGSGAAVIVALGGANVQDNVHDNLILDNEGTAIESFGTAALITNNGIANNTGAGIIVHGSFTTISGNAISGNGGAGVAVVSLDPGFQPDPTGVEVVGGIFEGNVGPAIDLGDDGPTPNDPGDHDPGPNDLMNYPVLTSVTTSTSSPFTTRIEGTFDGTTPATLRFYSSSLTTCNRDGFFVAQSPISVAGPFDITLPIQLESGSFESATATDENHSTSEFSDCRQSVASTQVSEPVASGGSVSTDTGSGATSSDPVVLSLTNGSSSTVDATLTEVDCTATPDDPLCLPAPVGNTVGDVGISTGAPASALKGTTAAPSSGPGPYTATLIYDASVSTGNLKRFQAFDSGSLLATCSRRVTTHCLISLKRLSGSKDLQVKVALAASARLYVRQV